MFLRVGHVLDMHHSVYSLSTSDEFDRNSQSRCWPWDRDGYWPIYKAPEKKEKFGNCKFEKARANMMRLYYPHQKEANTNKGDTLMQLLCKAAFIARHFSDLRYANRARNYHGAKGLVVVRMASFRICGQILLVCI